MSPDADVRCCLGCGRDTTSPDQLCSRCSNDRHVPPDESPIVAVVKVRDLAPSGAGGTTAPGNSPGSLPASLHARGPRMDGHDQPRTADPGSELDSRPLHFQSTPAQSMKGTA